MWNPSFILVNCKLARILLICFTVVFAASSSSITTNTTASAKSTKSTASTGTTIPALDNACDKCLEVIPDDCEWNEEVIPGSKTDFHHGVCPCPGDGTKDKCKVVQRRITGRNIQALQAWSASSLLMSICIAGKIYRIIPYNFYDWYRNLLSSKVYLCNSSLNLYPGSS